MSKAAIERAARRGARSVTTRRQIVEDAVAAALEKWQEAVLRQHSVRNWPAWAARVAINASRRLARRASGSASLAIQPNNRGDADPYESHGSRATLRRLLRAHLAQRKNLLRGRQLEVALKLAEVGMTFHRAAKELGMPRFNVKRAFRSALRRILSQAK